MPYYPDPNRDDGDIPYETPNYWEHMVSEYLGCSVFDVFELCYEDFLALRREAFITRMLETKEGREYLTNAAAFENTDIDRDAIRSLGGGI